MRSVKRRSSESEEIHECSPTASTATPDTAVSSRGSVSETPEPQTETPLHQRSKKIAAEPLFKRRKKVQDSQDDDNLHNIWERDVSLQTIREQCRDFAKTRGFEKFHTPRNIFTALVGEVGELAEIFQWRGEVPLGCTDWTEADRTHLGQEMSDVLIYLTRLADVCGIDLSRAVLDKMLLNEKKYPVKLVYGKASKWNEYDGMHADGTYIPPSEDQTKSDTSKGKASSTE
eukprot:Clim_evm12s142 gene=Clim_evmTU12s142